MTRGFKLDSAEAQAGVFGHVNFVDATWKQLREVAKDYNPGEDATCEEIYGCKEEEVGWMKVIGDLIGVEFYVALANSWRVLYRRPPEVMIW